MKFWKSGYTHSEENSYLRDVYGIPDYVTNVDNTFRVKRGVFTWSVMNLSDFPETKLGAVFCHSPLFRLLDTAWRLQLCSKANLDGRRGVSLRLRRDANDSGPEKVLASYRLGLGNSSNSVWFEAKESTFCKGNSFQLNTSVLGYLEDFFDDGAAVVCEIYVSYFPTTSPDTAWEVSEIDESLPADMSALLSSRHSMDVSIGVRGHQMWAHGSVLAARSPTLDSRLNLGSFHRWSDTARLQLSCSPLCLKCVLSYMYTGSFDYLARNAHFSVGLYEVADELSLRPLRDLLQPDRKVNRSRIHVHSAVEVYSARFDVGTFFSNTSFRTQARRHKNSDLRSSVLIYKIGQLPNYCVAFKLEIAGLGGCISGETALSLLNARGKGVAARMLSQDLNTSDSKITAIFVLPAAEFMSCDVVSSSISVRVAMRLYQMRHDHVKSLGLEPARGPGTWCWREQLAQDLKALLLCGYSSDATIVVEEESFKVHRPILAARSPYFHSLFYGGAKASSAVYLINDVKPRTFWLMLQFMYCGTLSHFKKLSLEDIMELYRASISYGLASLFGITSLFMKMMTGELNFVDS